MGKAGKKTRKFVRKHLKGALKSRRIYKSKRDNFQRRMKVGSRDFEEQERGLVKEKRNEGVVNESIENNLLEELFSEDEDSTIEDDSDSDGYISEDPGCPYISGSENENNSEDRDLREILSPQNIEIHMELAKQKKTLDRLKKKDPNFAGFLEEHKHIINRLNTEELSSEEDSEGDDQSETTGIEHKDIVKCITGYTLDVWCWLALEELNVPALSGILNGYRAACHCCLGNSDDISRQMVPNKGVFSNILMFLLHEADGIFRRLLSVTDSCSKENVMKLKNNSQWITVKPLLKSYLRSTLFLLSQLTDNQILEFAISRLRVSIIFFAAFPSLMRRLVKIIVHLWATGEESLFLSSFLIMKDMTLQLGPDCFELCLRRAYRVVIAQCKFVEPSNMKRIEDLGNSLVELYSLDVHRSYQKVLVCLQRLANNLHHAFKTKKKEELKIIHDWQYICCINIWVKFISLNIKDYDLQPMLYLAVQVIRGVIHLFPGPRYLPLRLKCAQMLNELSLSSGVFIPVAYLVFDFLEHGDNRKTDSKLEHSVSMSSILKAPKPWLKSRNFQEECVHSVVELLSAHFSQWSYHISFPDLATIPLIILKRFHEKTTVESIRRPVKRLIDQVEQNCEFVQRKRDDVSFSPNDLSSIESFLQLEKNSNTSFTTFYKSILQNCPFGSIGVK